MSRSEVQGWMRTRRWVGTLNLTLRIALLPAHVLLVEVPLVDADVDGAATPFVNAMEPACAPPSLLTAGTVS